MRKADAWYHAARQEGVNSHPFVIAQCRAKRHYPRSGAREYTYFIGPHAGVVGCVSRHAERVFLSLMHCNNELESALERSFPPAAFGWKKWNKGGWKSPLSPFFSLSCCGTTTALAF